MAATDTLLRPDMRNAAGRFQAGLGFGVESASRQVLLNSAVALARTAAAFSVPVVVSTSGWAVADIVQHGPTHRKRRRINCLADAAATLVA